MFTKTFSNLIPSPYCNFCVLKKTEVLTFWYLFWYLMASTGCQWMKADCGSSSPWDRPCERPRPKYGALLAAFAFGEVGCLVVRQILRFLHVYFSFLETFIKRIKSCCYFNSFTKREINVHVSFSPELRNLTVGICGQTNLF